MVAARGVSERAAWTRLLVPPRGPLLASARGLGAMSGPEGQVERSLQWGIWRSGCPCVTPLGSPVILLVTDCPKADQQTQSFLPALWVWGQVLLVHSCCWSTAAARWLFSWYGAVALSLLPLGRTLCSGMLFASEKWGEEYGHSLIEDEV